MIHLVLSFATKLKALRVLQNGAAISFMFHDLENLVKTWLQKL
jgi:hypothetical protein